MIKKRMKREEWKNTPTGWNEIEMNEVEWRRTALFYLLILFSIFYMFRRQRVLAAFSFIILVIPQCNPALATNILSSSMYFIIRTEYVELGRIVCLILMGWNMKKGFHILDLILSSVLSLCNEFVGKRIWQFIESIRRGLAWNYLIRIRKSLPHQLSL